MTGPATVRLGAAVSVGGLSSPSTKLPIVRHSCIRVISVCPGFALDLPVLDLPWICCPGFALSWILAVVLDLPSCRLFEVSTVEFEAQGYAGSVSAQCIGRPPSPGSAFFIPYRTLHGGITL
jgi:hypothetical protein